MGIDGTVGLSISYKIILMSHYTFTLPAEVYRWMVADQLIPNHGNSPPTQVKSMTRASSYSPQNKTPLFKTD